MKVNYEQLTEDCVQWIRDWFDKNGKNCNAVIGLSGGKDSTVVAGLCVKALGKDRVIGVAMPDNNQGLNDADKIAEHLGITFMLAPIGEICDAFSKVRIPGLLEWSLQTVQNIPPRVRMTMLYAIAQTYNGRVVGTCNASENFVGYFTRYGDGASDLEPLGSFTVTDVKGIGYVLGVPKQWVDKTPDDGLPNSMPDDEKFKAWGFSYAAIDKLIKEGSSGNKGVDEAIMQKHNKTKFKMNMGTIFYPQNPHF